MKLDLLKKSRFLFPGIISFILGYVILKNQIPDSNPFENYVYYLGCIIISAIYYVFNIRDIIWEHIIKKRVIDRYIAETIDNIYNKKYISPNINCKFVLDKLFTKKVIASKKQKRVFFNCLDNSKNQSLKEKSQIIMNNGVILTCLIDTQIITFFAIIILVVLKIINNTLSIYSRLLTFIGIVFILGILIIFCTKKHLILSNDQLEIINEDKACREILNDFFK